MAEVTQGPIERDGRIAVGDASALGARQTRSVSDALGVCRPLFIYAALFGVAVNLLLLTGPLYMLQVYDRVLNSGSVQTLVVLTLIVGIAYATLGLVDDVRARLASRAGLRLDRLLAEPLVRGAWSRTTSGSMAQGSDLLRSLDSYRNFVGGPGLLVATDLPFTPAFVIVIYMLHPWLGWFAAGAILLMAAITIIAQATTRKPLQEAQQAAQANGRRVLNVATAADAVRALGMGRRLAEIWRAERDDLVSRQAFATERGGSFKAASKSVRFFIQSLILGLGAWLVIRGELSSGAMIAASIILGRAMAPIDQALNVYRQWSDARGARTEIDAALSDMAATAPPPQSELPPIKGALRFEDLVYAPPGAARPMFSKMSFSVPAGASLGVIGPSGAGKTTLMRLITGLIQPNAGALRVDGAELAQYAADRIGPQIGYLPQEVALLNGSVRDNIARFEENRDAQAIAAAQTAGAHEMILRLPQGYDTQIGERGHTLSAGQRQRIGLARALFGDPMLVVLDEPNAHLDDSGAEALAQAIRSAKKRGATVIVVTHRRSIIVEFDLLLALGPDGSATFGPRDQMLKKLAEASRNAAALRSKASAASA